MSRWFRHYAGMMRDEKLVRAAIKSGQSIERVLWVWGAILESAAEIDDDGRFDVDGDEIAYFLRADSSDIHSVFAALSDAGRVAENRVVNWGNRQFTSDRSASRQAEYRKRKRQSGGPDDKSGDEEVTSLSRHGDAPETETETETDITPPSPPERGGGKHSIPKDWVLPAKADLPPRARELAEQWTDASYETHGEAFHNFWTADRRKYSDWRLVWANRVVALHGQVMRDQKFGNAPQQAATREKMHTADWLAHCEKSAASWRARGVSDQAKHWEDCARDARAKLASREATGPPRSVGKLVKGILPKEAMQ